MRWEYTQLRFVPRGKSWTGEIEELWLDDRQLISRSHPQREVTLVGLMNELGEQAATPTGTSPPSVEVEHGLPVAWCRTSADSAVHQPRVEAADPDGLRGRLLAEGTEFPVQLAEQGKIRSGNRRKHQEQT